MYSHIKFNLFKLMTVKSINLTRCLPTINGLIHSFQSILSWLAVFIKNINFLRGPIKIAMRGPRAADSWCRV